MQKIIQNNSIYSVADFTDTHDNLPYGYYLLKYSDDKGYYLQQQTPIKLPSKLYGEFSITERWKKSYENNTSKNLGILLSGPKGTGKTITAQVFCSLMQKPVIFITEDYEDPAFESFISSPVFNDTIIFIDEFEKVYDDEQKAEKLLTIMDGIYTTKFIFLLTVNDVNRVSKKMLNRLNRIKYHKIFKTLELNIIDNIVDDLLINKEHKDSIYEVVDSYQFITPDILIALIKDMNLFNETASECAKHLNLSAPDISYDIFVHFQNLVYKCYRTYDFNLKLNPEIVIEFQSSNLSTAELEKHLPDCTRIDFTKLPITKLQNSYEFHYNDEITIVMKKIDSEFQLMF
jgi:hypothetical protein